MRCLEKRAADRPQTAAELVHALDALVTPTSGMASSVAPTGADIARNPKAAVALLAKGCNACAADGADVVILGGAGLAGLAEKLKSQVDVPLLDGVACAISMAEALAGQKTVRMGTQPAPVESIGLSKGLAKLIGSS